LVTSWASYKAFANHAEKFNKTPEDADVPQTTMSRADGVGAQGKDEVEKGESDGHVRGSSAGGKSDRTLGSNGNGNGGKSPKSPGSGSESEKSEEERKPSGPEEAWHEWEREQMEELLGEIRGHLGESHINLRQVKSKLKLMGC
jgi:phospholipase D1/2